MTEAKQPRIIAWDIESSGLNADFGIILCVGYKIVGEKEKPKVLSLLDYPSFQKDPTNDKHLVKDVAKVLSGADALLSWYGSKRRFDLPFFTSRLLFHKLPPLPPVPQVDGWRIARDHLKLHSNRLQSVAEFLGLEDKTPIKGPHWIKALAGDRRSFNYIISHCRVDVEVLEQAYLRLRPLQNLHPSYSLLLGTSEQVCPTCGSPRLQSRGKQITRTRTYQRLQCQACGAWSRGTKSLQSTSLISLA